MFKMEMDEHLGYEKHSVLGNNTDNSRNGYGRKTINSDYGECEIAVSRDRKREFEPKIIEKRQSLTDEIEQKINDRIIFACSVHLLPNRVLFHLILKRFFLVEKLFKLEIAVHHDNDCFIICQILDNVGRHMASRQLHRTLS